jgi:hypothetical protein
MVKNHLTIQSLSTKAISCYCLLNISVIHFPAFIIEHNNLEMWHTVYSTCELWAHISRHEGIYNEGTGSIYLCAWLPKPLLYMCPCPGISRLLGLHSGHTQSGNSSYGWRVDYSERKKKTRELVR